MNGEFFSSLLGLAERCLSGLIRNRALTVEIKEIVEAKIKHSAILTSDPGKLAEFYKQSFGFNEVARSGAEQEAIYVSHGYTNVALLPAWNRKEGIFHFGVEIDDLHEAVKAAPVGGRQRRHDLPANCLDRPMY